MKQLFAFKRDPVYSLNNVSQTQIVLKHVPATVVEKLRTGNPEINCMIALPRTYIYWPHLDIQLKQLSRQCNKCSLATKTPRKSAAAMVSITVTVAVYKLILLAHFMDKLTFCQLMRTASGQKSPSWNIQLQTARSENYVNYSTFSQFTSALFSEFCRHNRINHIKHLYSIPNPIMRSKALLIYSKMPFKN